MSPFDSIGNTSVRVNATGTMSKLLTLESVTAHRENIHALDLCTFGERRARSLLPM